jgi:hypothetical protein
VHTVAGPDICAETLVPRDRLHVNLSGFLTQNELCPYSGLAEVVALAVQYTDFDDAHAKVYWVHAGRTVSIGPKCIIDIPRWWTGIHNHMTETIRYCKEEVFFGIPFEQLGLNLDPMHTIHDDHANRTPGLSFMSHLENR